MGTIANASKSLTKSVTSVTGGIGKGMVCPLKQVAKPTQARQLSTGGSFPIINEMNGLAEGITQGDISKVAFNGAILAYGAQSAGQTKVATLTSNNKLMQVGALSMANQL